jgi:hypothetical protein
LGDTLKRIYNLWRTPNRETDLTDDFAASPTIKFNEWHPHELKNALGYKLLIRCTIFLTATIVHVQQIT